jgi:hypothetical protein
MVSEIASFNVAAAYKLYAAVLGACGARRGAAKHIIMTDGALDARRSHFWLCATPQPEEAAVLWFTGYREVPFLIRDVTVTQVPSVAALRRCVPCPPDPPPEALHRFGDPWFTVEQAAQAQQQQNVQVATIESQSWCGRHQNGRHGQRGLAQLPRLPDTADEVRSRVFWR